MAFRTKNQILCDLRCKLSKSIEYLSVTATTKYSGASVARLLKDVQHEVDEALEASDGK